VRSGGGERCALRDGPCRWDAVCPLHETWRSASEALRDALTTTTLATIAARDQALGVLGLPRAPDSHRPIPTSLTLSDRVELDGDPEILIAWVAHPERLGRAVAQAYREADAVRLRTRPRTPPWAPVEASVAVHPAGSESGPGGGAGPDQSRDPGARSQTLSPPSRRFELAWEATGADGSSTHADLTLAVVARAAGGSELALAGFLRPPSRGKGASLDAELELVSRLARVTARAFLRSVTRDAMAWGGPPRRRRLVERAGSGRRHRSAGATPVSWGGACHGVAGSVGAGGQRARPEGRGLG